ncbi:MAG: cache domain-containing protein [Anaerolineales bacterium]|nr:cache domain-containing protein [Anaerolineales bacterium]
MRRFLSRWFGGRLLGVLIISFGVVAILTGVLNTLVISRVIDNYLASAQSDRVARDMEISNGLYQQKLDEVVGLGERTAWDTGTITNLPGALQGNPRAINAIDQVILRKITVPNLTGSQVILVLDRNGEIIIGRTWSADGQVSSAITSGNWGDLPIVLEALRSNQPQAGTEIVAASFLQHVFLDEQALVPVRETPQDAPVLFDPREGTAGLALVGVYPLRDAYDRPLGVVVSAYLFNNDFSFVDYMKNVAQIETTTIFLGDLRVSTNVLDRSNVRAVGTRVSQTVYERVLVGGEPYFGRVFVVDDWYTGQYEPLRDHHGAVVGMLYVGVRESVFKNLVYAFNSTATLIALVSILVAGVFAIPIARFITRPIGELAQANRRLAQGDMDVRVQPFGRGEISLLGHSFNNMVETLRETQRELLQKEKLASMGQLAAGVAHELNNPLGSIQLFADILYKDAPDGSRQREDLKTIIGETQRCKVIVADLLNFARQQEVLAQETDLHALLEAILTRIVEQPAFERVRIVRDFDPDLPAIQADPAQLQQVFINLFSNSADAMEQDGMLTISTRRMDADTIEVRVADSGTGVPAEHMDKIFTPFFTTKPAGKGTGLGLAIVYGIIKMHRGQIHLQSQPGQGTTVVITLPVYLPDRQLDRSSGAADLIG